MQGYTKLINDYWASSTTQKDNTWEAITYDVNGVITAPVGLVAQETAETQDTTSKVISNLVQGHLDEAAKEWGYDSIYTAVGYVGDPNPTFNSEAIMFRNWRSAVWVYVNAEQVKLQNAARTMPTDAELIAELPLLDTYK